ncbi:MAG: PAS domain S-box protein [Chloroflexi bacterium]|jgi:diguanylate cyclase (GGDEF)-like protein/PAS domain S-box-containing protein|nr:PAS domain S-box protein [Chloroflexota bacterium]MBT4304900.1 PAS domain S-box protein [Chloroflexota bacterium]
MNKPAFLKSYKNIFMAIGIIFGMTLLIGSFILESIILGERLTLDFIIHLQLLHPIYTLIETAPLIMGALGGVIGIQRDKIKNHAQDLEQKLEKATKSEVIQKEYFQALIQNAPLGIVSLDNDHNIVTSNQSFENMFGYSNSELFESNLDSLITNEKLNNSATEITERVKEGEAVHLIHQRMRKDGELIYVEISGVPIQIEGEQKGVLAIYENITERKILQEELQKNEKRFRSVVETANDAIITINGDAKITFWNDAAERIFGYTQEEIIGQDVTMIIPENARRKFMSGLSQFGNSDQSDEIGTPIELIGLKKNSLEFPTQLSFSKWEAQGQVFFTALIRDISEQKNIKKQIIESEANFKSLFDDSPISLWEEDFSPVKKYIDTLMNKGISNFNNYFTDNPDEIKKCAHLVKITKVNNATLQLFDAKSIENLRDGLGNILIEESIKDFGEELLYLIEGKTKFKVEIQQKKISGEKLYAHLQLSIAPGYEDTWGKVFISITDITEQKIAQENYKYMSFHDALTGLYNRAYFERELSRLEKSRQYPITIIVFDMDNLKEINDSEGHAAGDEAIRSAATMFRDLFREEDMVARIGGDEFIAILPKTNQESHEAIKERVEENIYIYNQKIIEDGFRHPNKFSLGVATVKTNQCLNEGYILADQRMYQDKMSKKNLNLSKNLFNFKLSE